ncbi:MAG TPA: Gfo/Idh/MocA family oxidoreductase [Candidatus Limnocylindrales bacterium]|nr:Gfo/Idh/MocA family oxidoreductase [Candidatus Limnocylindrales bacterium]
MSNALRVAVLGFWHVHARDYARQAVDHPATELIAVWDDDADRGRAGASEFGASFAPDLDELLRRADLDAVIITTATNVHRDVMVRAATAGKHIFTEKVLAPTVADAEAIVKAADANEVVLVVSLPRLYHGYTRAIRDVLDAGVLGRVTGSRIRLSHDGAVSRDGAPGWLPERFFDRERAIGGALTDLGCHPVYLTQLFLGATPNAVSATYRSFTKREVEDHAVVTVGYEDERIGVIEAGFVSRNPFTVEIFGTEGTLAYTSDGSTLKVASGGSGSEGFASVPVPDDGPDPFAQWVDHIQRGTRADENVARAIELTRLVVAANRAAAESRTIAYSAG